MEWEPTYRKLMGKSLGYGVIGSLVLLTSATMLFSVQSFLFGLVLLVVGIALLSQAKRYSNLAKGVKIVGLKREEQAEHSNVIVIEERRNESGPKTDARSTADTSGLSGDWNKRIRRGIKQNQEIIMLLILLVVVVIMLSQPQIIGSLLNAISSYAANPTNQSIATTPNQTSSGRAQGG